MNFHNQAHAVHYLAGYVDIVSLAAVGIVHAGYFGGIPFYMVLYPLFLYSARLYEIPNLFNARRTPLFLFIGAVMSVVLSALVTGTSITWADAAMSLGGMFVVLIDDRLVMRRIYEKTQTIVLDVPDGHGYHAALLGELSKAASGKIDYTVTAMKGYDSSEPVLPGTLHGYKKDAVDEPDSIPVIASLHGACELYLKRIPVELVSAYPDYYENLFRERSRYDTLKRVVDVIFSIAVLAVTLPLSLLIAAAILIEDGRPVVFRQVRMGQGGKPFIMLKFRSLKTVAADGTAPNASIERRVLRIGGLIRKTRLDELLNFVCVVMGTMSVVGPRPEMVEYHEDMGRVIPGYRYRSLVKPGITGWAQIYFGHTSSLAEYEVKTSYDLFYIRNRSPVLDIRIALKTLETMLARRGAR